MRTYQQRQILELLQTIEQAQTEGLYADCQKGAYSAGTFIEEIKGYGTQTVRLLEEYCELLYKASQGEISENVLRKHLIDVENSVKYELRPDKIEVVFLSYKASMSDSIESIYLAAKADPNCDAYWIPIPYYDRNPDGTFGEMHYEGADCYSENIECTDWQEYDIEMRYPDAIFTFNPYDKNNYVTSVHPHFYCRRLRKLTDLLVYVPYFVSLDDAVEKHFAALPGCLYAHKVIVQSNKIRNIYINAFKEFERTNNCKGRFGKPNDKFVALGSPKFDKIINTKREDCRLPDAWQELIGVKKVMFYNTSVKAILEGGGQYLKKLCHVFDTFRNRNDVVLWWRPHPLSVATYQSMRGQMVAEYMQIVENYICEGWGIYDDTPDLNRAIAWSDAYYGDWSSLVPLSAVTGKPVMIQNAKITEPEKSYFGLTFDSLYEDGTYYWICALNHNGLYKINKTTWKAEFIGKFPDEDEFGWYLYRSITEYDGKLYFAPGTAKEIAIYDLEKNIFEKVRLKEIQKHKKLINYGSKFLAAILHRSQIFFIPGAYTAIVKYDPQSGSVHYYSDWLEPLCKLIVLREDAFLARGFKSEAIYMTPAAGANAVVAFNMDICVSQVYQVGKGNRGYQDILPDGADYWLLPRRDAPIVRWTLESGDYQEYDFKPEGFVGEAVMFSGFTLIGGHLWLLPFDRNTNMALKLRISDGDVSVAEEINNICAEKWSEMEFFPHNYFPLKKQVSDNTIVLHTGKGNRFMALDSETGQKREEVVEGTAETAEILLKLRRRSFKRKATETMITQYDCLKYESIFSFVSDFADYVTESSSLIDQKQVSLFLKSKDAGSAIWKACKSEIE